MANRYAPVERYREGYQSAYDAGLSYFPDTPFMAAMPLGDIVTDLAVAGGTALGGPAGGVTAGTASGVIQRWFGGSAVDQARQERVNYFAQLAANGNVAAAQLILGAPPNVSGNERGMWETAATLLNQQAPSVMADARTLGPAWLQNSGDTAQNYPAMRRYTATWSAQNPFTSAIGAASGAFGGLFTPSPVPGQPFPTAARNNSGVLLVGAVAVVGVLFLRSRRRRS